MNTLMGEAEIAVEGRTVRLKLTLDALARIEETLGVTSLAELAVGLSNLSASQLLRVLDILARAAGGDGSEIAGRVINLRDALSTLAKLFRGLLGMEAPGKPTTDMTDGAVG